MANVLSGTKFLYFDAVSGAAVARELHIIGIYWVNNTGTGLDIATADIFTCTDTLGKVILSKKAIANGDGLEVTFGFPGLAVQGLIITVMDGGACFVICDREILAT